MSIRDVHYEEPWRVAKGHIEHLFESYGITDIHWKRISREDMWHPGRTAQAFVDGKMVAVVGEISPTVSKLRSVSAPPWSTSVNSSL